MAAWRIVTSIGAVLVAAGMAAAQTYPLAEVPKAGDCFQVQLNMTLAGEIRVFKDAKPVSMKLEATGTHGFVERVLAVGADGLPQKNARVYETALAVIKVNRERSERVLRPERHLIVAQRTRDQSLVYCPKGLLTREELELTGEHFDTLAATGLLPGKAVAIGETWKVSNPVAEALCNFEGLTAQDLTCKLEEVKDNQARVSVSGSSTGIELGALAKLKITGTYTFDLAQHRLVAVEWQQKDERDQWPASPASTGDIIIRVKRAFIPQPPELDEASLVCVPDGEPTPQMIQLTYHDPQSRLNLVYGREWQTVGQTEQHVVLRLLDRGDLVAQVTITPWMGAKPGEHLTAEAFQEQMARTPGWDQGDVLQSGVVPSEAGRWVYRISALGQMDGQKLLQNFYLVAGPGGEQVVLAFTMAQAQAEKLGARDLSLVGSVDFPKK